MEVNDITSDWKYTKITKDGITYDLTITAEKNAYDSAYGTNGFMNNLVPCLNSANSTRKYETSNLSSVPTHPIRTDFGYETLKSGSTIHDVKTKKTYMYDEITDSWVEQ